jgi:hypothetical protein
LVIDILKALELSNIFVGLLFISGYQLSNMIEAEIFYIRRILKNFIILLVVEADKDILIELLGKLKYFLNEASSLVVEDVVSLRVFLFFEIS